MAFLKFLIPSPNPLPRSAILPVPKMSKAINAIIRSSGIPSLPIMGRPPAAGWSSGHRPESRESRCWLDSRPRRTRSQREERRELEKKEENYGGTGVPARAGQLLTPTPATQRSAQPAGAALQSVRFRVTHEPLRPPRRDHPASEYPAQR